LGTHESTPLAMSLSLIQLILTSCP
jgi:hypothetical protein